jgi:hypothetical protein
MYEGSDGGQELQCAGEVMRQQRSVWQSYVVPLFSREVIVGCPTGATV